MKIVFVVNNIKTEWADYTTTFLAYEATRLNHEVWYVNVGDFAYDADENLHAHAYSTANVDMQNNVTFLNGVNNKENSRSYVNLAEMDVLMLRNDPSDDAYDRPWARLAAINFSRFATRSKVLVLNDPDGLSKAVNKLYLQLFPKKIRPDTLISRDKEQIKQFAADRGIIVIKPLVGSGGRNVFLLRPEDKPNINQMLETVSRDGYIIAQEYLPDAVNGDVRVFLMNGKLLAVGGKIAAFRRIRGNGDMRSNMTAGATSAPYHPNPSIYTIVEKVAPLIQQDGLFLVGLDVVGDKIMEINVFSPGGLCSAETYNQVDYTAEIINNIEKKVFYRKKHPELSNAELASHD